MKKLKRAGALALVIVIIAMYVTTFVLAFTADEYVPVMLFLDVVIPVLGWAVALVARLFRDRGEELRQMQEHKDVEKE